jgi:hypothetical protein
MFIDGLYFATRPRVLQTDLSSTRGVGITAAHLRHTHEELSEPFSLITVTFFRSKLCRPSSAPQYLLRARLLPSILTGSNLIPLRKLYSGSHLQEKHTGPPQHKQRVDDVFLGWKEFYTRARAIRNEGSCGDLMKRANEEPIDLFNASDTTLNAIDEKIEKESLTTFPKMMIQRYGQHTRPSVTPFRKPAKPRRSMILLK